MWFVLVSSLSADEIVARMLVQQSHSRTILALAAAAVGGNATAGLTAQRRLLQLCCNLTRSTEAVGILFGDGAETAAEIAAAQESIHELLKAISTQLLSPRAAVHKVEADRALGAMLRLLTNITADPNDGQKFVCDLLPALLVPAVVNSAEEDVRSGLHAALRNLCYVRGPRTKKAEQTDRHTLLIVEVDILPVLLTPLLAPANMDLGEETRSMLHPSLAALIPADTTDENATVPDLDPVAQIRRDALESLLILTQSAIGEEELSSRYIFPLMESHYDAELDADLAKLNQARNQLTMCCRPRACNVLGSARVCTC